MENGFLELINLLDLYIFEYLIVLIVIAAIYYIFCIKKMYGGIFDPLLYSIILSIFSISVVVFMYLENSIEKEYLFYSAIITEVFYLIGIIFFSKPLKKNINLILNEKKDNDEYVKNILFYLYTILFFSVKIIFFIFYGIPLFDFNNHVDALLANGFIAKLTTATSPILYFLVIDRLINKKTKDVYIIIIGIIIILGLSGSKGALLSFVSTIYFYYLYCLKFNLNIINLKKIYISCFFIAIVGGVVPFVFGSISSENVSFETIIGRFALRLVANGDIFAYFYNSNISDFIMDNNNFWNMFISYYGATFRLLSYDEINGSIGYQIVKEIYNTAEATAAPNTRHNIWGLVAFGVYFAPIFSLTIGLLTSFVTRYLYIRLSGLNIYTFLLYIIIYSGVTTFAGDFLFGLDYIIYGIMFNSIIMLIVYNLIKILKC